MLAFFQLLDINSADENATEDYVFDSEDEEQDQNEDDSDKQSELMQNSSHYTSEDTKIDEEF